MITILFTTAAGETAGIVLVDPEDGSIIRHASVGKPYERSYIMGCSILSFPLVSKEPVMSVYPPEEEWAVDAAIADAMALYHWFHKA